MDGATPHQDSEIFFLALLFLGIVVGVVSLFLRRGFPHIAALLAYITLAAGVISQTGSLITWKVKDNYPLLILLLPTCLVGLVAVIRSSTLGRQVPQGFTVIQKK